MATSLHAAHRISAIPPFSRSRISRCRSNLKSFHHAAILACSVQQHISASTSNQRNVFSSTRSKPLRYRFSHRRPSLTPGLPIYIASSTPKRGFTSSSTTFQVGLPIRSNDRLKQGVKDQMQKQKTMDDKRGNLTKLKDLSRQGRLNEYLGDDFGLLPGTVSFPSSKLKPPLFSKDMLRLMRLMLKHKFVSWVGVMTYRWQTFKKPRPKIESKRQLVSIAKDLYERVNTAFASGDTAALQQTCCGGMKTSLTERIDARQQRNYLSWQLLRYTSKPKVVSHRATFIPEDFSRPDQITQDRPKRSAIRQAVVKITSVQALSEIQNGDIYGANDVTKEKEVTEYVVIQKAMSQGKEGPWKIWGTGNFDMSVDEIDAKISSLNRAESISSMLASAQT